jgi:hypothetical protein
MSIIKKPQELEPPKTVRMLIYGQPGLGKSTLALSAPNPLMLDFDGGVHRVQASHQSDTVQVRSWEDVIAVLDEDLSSYKTLIIDTAGKALDFMSAHIIAKDPKKGSRDGQLALQGYGARKGMFQRFVAQASLMGKHLIFVAHDKEEKDGDTKIIRPEIGGSSSGDLIKELDLVGYMEAQGKKRTISFDPCEKFYGKNTCGLDSLYTLPDVNAAPNTFLQTVLGKFAENAEIRKEVLVGYDALMEQIKIKLEAVDGADEANDFVTWVGTLPHIWDSKIQASHLLRDKAKVLGITFDTKAKAYVAPALETADVA